MTPPPASEGVNDGHYVYVLRCADDSYYTGYTTDPARRVAEHNAGDGAKYTRGRTPVEPVYLEAHDSKSDAMSREYEIKQHSRAAKEALVAGGDASMPSGDEPSLPTDDESSLPTDDESNPA